MSDREHAKVLLKVRDTPRFPAPLWAEFRETASRRGETWIDALRGVVERYIREHADRSPHADTTPDQ